MTQEELKIAGAILYACEGTKMRKDMRFKNTYFYSIEFTNSEPRIVRMFLRFMREILCIDTGKIKGQLFLYPDLDRKKVMQTWAKETGIPLEQFQKIIMLKAKVSKFKPNPLGTFKVRYTNKKDFLKLQSIIEDVWRDG